MNIIYLMIIIFKNKVKSKIFWSLHEQIKYKSISLDHECQREYNMWTEKWKLDEIMNCIGAPFRNVEGKFTKIILKTLSTES